ncbi:LuxR C-terminal-related transcriptional regulator [Cupriavidus consociatus]|uniref:LuxR C-terminal-related transcriptional regulator n=1 Tax=Cupriavidus consociatus TaxID=2821357 RepID=UPI001FD866F9|nr:MULTISPECIES: LuxR C-terminal-related transcriptional regulator [unclassified Cupriavidus]MDK2661794.1 LuxR C-terminal-related transcriptional regulator [Cupriavidus sp. LEh21]
MPALILTKLAPPRTRHYVHRARAIGLLRTGLERKLTVLVAPAGFGKTSLLSEWKHCLEGEGCAVGWLSIDADDDDLFQFCAYLLAAARNAYRQAGEPVARRLEPDPLASAEAMLAELLNAVATLPRRLVLVLDDFDRLAAPAIHEAVFRLLRYAPDNLHVLVAGRSEPAFPLSYFEARGQLLRLDVQALRFDGAETQAFFSAVSGRTLSAAQTEALLQATEGWVAGLQLASFALSENEPAREFTERLPFARRSIEAYLNENVFVHVPEALQIFLLRTSVLDRMSVPLCNAVAATDAAHDSFEWLVARNMFVRPLDPECEWYRYHALFAEYLRKRLLRERPHEAVCLHRRASEWFAAQSLWPEAVRHALAAGDVDRAAGWVEQCAMSLVEESDVRTVLSWVAKLPAEAVHGRLRLRLAHAWALALTMQTLAAKAALQAVEDDIDRGGLALSNVVRVGLQAVRALIAGLSDESQLSLEMGRKVLALGPEASSWEKGIGLTTQIFGLSYAAGFDEVKRLRRTLILSTGADTPIYAKVYRQSMVGLSLFVEGRLGEAVQTLEDVLRESNARAGRHSAASVLPVGYLAAIHYEWNDLDRVAELLEGRLEMALQACSLGPLIGFCVTLARLRLLAGNQDEAYRIVEDAEAIARERQWLRMQVACKAEAIRISIGAGDISRATRIGNDLEALVGPKHATLQGSYLETWQRFQVAHCRLLVRRGRAAQAVPILQGVQAELRAAGMLYMSAQISVMLAVALHSAGQRAEAVLAMGAALAYGQKNGLHRVFIDAGPPVREILDALRQRQDRLAGIEPWYLSGLCAGFDAPASAPEVKDEQTEPVAASRLSAREVEILDYVAQGLSNKEIARAIRVAPETVKWHLKNIFEKLKVNSRIQAVRSGLGRDLPRVTERTVPRS